MQFGVTVSVAPISPWLLDIILKQEIGVTKSELIDRLGEKAQHLQGKELELAIKELLEQMAQTLNAVNALK